MDWNSEEGRAKKALAESIVKAHAAKWQVLNRSEWKYQFRGKTLVRFIDLTRVREDEAVALLDYLSDDICKETLSLVDQGIGDEWCPVRAWFEATNKSAGNVVGIRLYHALQTDLSENVDGPYVVDDGCAYKVSVEYHWGEDKAPTAPKSTSGVVKKISGLQRDPESGKYSYTIETHERVMQRVDLYVTHETKSQKVEEAYYIGVKEDEVENTGLQASSGNGVVITRKITKNADCTKDIHNTQTTAKKWIEKYDWVSGNTHHWVVKYGNYPLEFAGTVTPSDASVQKEDSVNDFGLHDGTVRWSKGPWTTTVGDLKFVKHGRQIYFYMTRKNDRGRYYEHKKLSYQVVHICGDAYTDYISQEMDADPYRTTSGTIAVKLVRGPYKDKDGNLLAEWKRIVAGMVPASGGWEQCVKSCDHGHRDGEALHPWQHIIDQLQKSIEYRDASNVEMMKALVDKLDTLFRG